MTDIIGLDPGLTTGWCRMRFSDAEPLSLIEYGQIVGGTRGVVSFFMDQGVCDILVSESFRLGGRTPKPEIEPLRVEGALLALSSLGRIPTPVFQSNVYKSHAHDALLKRAGLYQRGMPHANDAIRHAIAWAKVNGHRPTIEWLWPVPEELR